MYFTDKSGLILATKVSKYKHYTWVFKFCFTNLKFVRNMNSQVSNLMDYLPQILHLKGFSPLNKKGMHLKRALEARKRKKQTLSQMKRKM